MMIDSHAHVWKQDDAYPMHTRKDLADKADLWIDSFTNDDLLKMNEANEIQQTNLVQKKQWADAAFLLDAIRRHPTKFVGTAAIDPRMPNLSDELIRLQQGGIRACRIYPALSESQPITWLQDDIHKQLFRLCNDLGLIIACLASAESFLEIDRMCGEYPHTTVTIDHMGLIGRKGTVPNADELKQLCELSRHENIYVKLSGLHNFGAQTPPYGDMREVASQVVHNFGVDRCMWGTDAPYQTRHPHTAQASMDFIDSIDITSPQKDAIFGLTAQRLYFS